MTTATSPQLNALGPIIRILAVYLDAVAAYGDHCPQVDARIESAILVESGRGKTLSRSERTMAELGWRSAEDIFNRAGIPEKHQAVVSLALWGDPTRHKGRYYTIREIARLTNHPPRTVRLWLADDMPKLRQLADVYVPEMAEKPVLSKSPSTLEAASCPTTTRPKWRTS